MNIDAKGTFDKEKGTLTVVLDLAGHTELEHEMLAAFFRCGCSVSISPTHHGDKLSAQFSMFDPDAFDLASHNLENRKRADDGRPSLEQEADATRAQAANQKQATIDAKNAAAAAEKDRLESRDRVERMAAKEIADRHAAQPTPAEPKKVEPAKDAEHEAKEPEKVQ